MSTGALNIEDMEKGVRVDKNGTGRGMGNGEADEACDGASEHRLLQPVRSARDSQILAPLRIASR